jgi:hypothetical protein
MPDLEPVLAKAKELLVPYEKQFTKRGGSDLYSIKKIEAFGSTYEEMFFAGVKLNKGAVGFYFMPIYTHESEFKEISPLLRTLLKGKSCFHLKKFDDEIERELKALLKKGYEVYKKAGWV